MTGINPAGWSEGHYACVIGYHDDTLILQDPVDGRVEMPLLEFERRWHDMEADGRKHVRWGMAVGGPVQEGEKYDRCVRKVAAKGDVDNPHAVCKASVESRPRSPRRRKRV